jgi:hypothetical protein
MPNPVECPNCKGPLAEYSFNQPGLAPCPICEVKARAYVFPAFFRNITPGADGEALIVETKASCFYHPQKKAILPCDGCGRFLCALCDCALRGQHFCPACLQAGQKKGKIKHLERERTLYDNIALSLAVYPLLIFYLTIITAPMTLYIALRYWNAPRSIVHRTRARLVIAILIASLEIVGWGVGIYLLATQIKRHG